MSHLRTIVCIDVYLNQISKFVCTSKWHSRGNPNSEGLAKKQMAMDVEKEEEEKEKR